MRMRLQAFCTAKKMPKPKVLITGYDIPLIALDILKDHFEIILNKKKPFLDKKDILESIRGVHAVLWTLRSYLDKDMLNAAGPQLRVISSFSIGTDFVDKYDLKARNISIYNVTNISDPVADIAILLLLAASRNLEKGRRHIINGTCTAELKWLIGTELTDSIIGIIGLGHIGFACAERLKGFKINKIIYCGNKENPKGTKIGAIFTPLDQLLRISDFIIISCPLTPETNNMFNKEAFNKMKTTAVIVNIARGAIIDQDALIEALENNRIFGAGLDVTVPEPLPPNHKLLTLPNCVITPHIGNATFRARNEMAKQSAINILRAFNIMSKYDK